MTAPAPQSPPGPEALTDAALTGADALPPGDHPIEVAARSGFGPLSRLGRITWHGQARPCVSCGQLILREQQECDHCGQDLSEAMLQRMREHAGPWYVFEHVRPFPGVSLQRIIRQIRRGLITPTSIVRGPATDHQWRFAGETPGLCIYFGRCWKCHAEVTLRDTRCPSCDAGLLPEVASAAPRAPAPAPLPPVLQRPAPPSTPAPVPAAPPTPAVSTARITPATMFDSGSFDVETPIEEDKPETTPEWEALRAAVSTVQSTRRAAEPAFTPPKPAISPAWVAGIVLAIAMIALVILSQIRNDALRNRPPAQHPNATAPAPAPAQPPPPRPPAQQP